MTEGLQVSGWCSTGECPKCPRVFEPRSWPDPVRRGTFYTTKHSECQHHCHNRVESELA